MIHKEKTKAQLIEELEVLHKRIADLEGENEYKQGREVLRKSIERLNLAVQASHDGVWDWDIVTNEVYISAQFKRLLGYEDHELENRYETWESRINPEDRDRVLKALSNHLERRIPYDLEYQIRVKDGSYKWFSSRGQAIWSTEGKAIRMTGSMRDITGLKQGDELLRTHARVLECMGEGVNVADTAGIIVLTNPAFDIMFGYRHGELIGKHVTVLNAYPPEENMRIVAEIIEQLKTKGIWVGEFNNRKKDGTPFSTRCRITALEMSGQIYWISAQEDITDRKQVIENLNNSLSLLSATLDSTGDGILAVDLEGKIVNYNRTFAEMWIIPDDILASRDQKKAQTFVQEQLEEPEYFMIRLKEIYKYPDKESYDILKFKDGRIFERYTRPQESDGKILGRVVSFRDITERKRAEWALQESESRYRAIVEDQQELICRWIPRGTLTFVNDAYCRYFGKKREELIGHSFVPLIPEEDQKRVKKHFSSLNRDNRFGRHEQRVLMPNGDVRWQEWSNRVIVDEEGRIIEYQSVGLDITDRRRAEETARSLAKFPSENPNPVLRIAKDGTILYANTASQPLLNKWGLKDNQQLPDDWRQLILDVYGSKHHKRVEVECGDRTLSVLITPIAGTEYINLYGTDITDRIRAEEALKKTHQELEKRVEERTKELQISREKIRELSQNILQIHEDQYKTISRELHDNIGPTLNAVRLGLERMERDSAIWDTKVFSKYRRDIHDSVLQLRELSKDVRNLSKQMRSEVLDELGLNSALESYTNNFQRRTGIQTQFKTRHSKLNIPANVQTHLYRIVQEALSNVNKHAQASYVVVEIGKVKNQLVLSILDNGNGFQIDKSVKEEKPPRGIGLINIQERANLLKGKAEISSNPKNGTKIVVRVPLSV